METAKTWIRAQGLTNERVGRALGLSKWSVGRMLGRRSPITEHFVRGLYRLSNGHLTPNDIYGLHGDTLPKSATPGETQAEENCA